MRRRKKHLRQVHQPSILLLERLILRLVQGVLVRMPDEFLLQALQILCMTY
jgi:hypothetical protein